MASSGPISTRIWLTRPKKSEFKSILKSEPNWFWLTAFKWNGSARILFDIFGKMGDRSIFLIRSPYVTDFWC